jgi:Flp pilus assembly protein TadD
VSVADSDETADKLYSRGESACDEGRFEEAIDLIGRAIRSNGGVPAYHYKLGVALQSAGRLLQAEDSYRAAIGLDGNHAKALNNLGSLLHARGQLDAAIATYDRALDAQSDFLEATRNLTIAWLDRGDTGRAEQFARRALRLDPTSSELHSQLVDALARSGKHSEALAASRRAVELGPHSARAHKQLGDALRESGDLAGAVAHQRKALELDPNIAEAWNDLGFLCELRGETADAAAHYRRAIAIRPGFAQAHFNYGLWLLASGDFSRGWEECEWRWQLPELAGLAPKFERPMWDGSDITDKTVLLYAEQGLGDVIQFVRYVPLVTRKGARVLVRCPWQLKALIEHAAGAAGVFGEDETLPDFDLCCALVSLPRIFGTTTETVPARIPYLGADRGKIARWRGKIAADEGEALRVGIVWASHSLNARYARRKSIGLEAFAPLAEAGPVVFYSLQKGPAGAECARAPVGMRLVDTAGEIGDFSDTAAVIENLDLVISVDTSVAHLAGAMGKPVWVLATFPLDWRWVGERDGRNLWYPTVRVFHQTRMDDWAAVIRQVADALIECVRANTVR